MDVTMESAPGDKIRLFRAMFRGREDVYARRYGGGGGSGSIRSTILKDYDIRDEG